MKKLFVSIFCILYCFTLYVFASQPPEYGLLFMKGNCAGKLRDGVSNRRLNTAGPLRIGRYVKSDGTLSLVFIVNILPQLFYCATRQQKPLVIAIFSGKEQSARFLKKYQEIAEDFKNDILCIVIDKNRGMPVINLLKMILKFEKIAFSDFDSQLPIFLFCHKNFVVLQNGAISFKRGGIKLLSKFDFDKDNLSENINKMLIKDENLHTVEDEISVKKQQSPLHNRWEKLKKWIKAYFF
ncbi:hypothetical protein ACFLYH_02290 [Candidatus Dependentiae bacterium]